MSEQRMSREELTRRAVEDREKQLSDRANRGSNTFATVSFTPITVGKGQSEGAIVGRLLGNPYAYREDGTDHRVIFQSWIKTSAGKSYPFIFPMLLNASNEPILDQNWIVMKVIKAVMRGTWNPHKGDKGAMDYDYEGTEIFDIVAKNSTPNARFISGWRPSPNILMNFIRRDKIDWHRENKKTLVVSKHYQPAADGKGQGFWEQGVSLDLYNTVASEIMEHSGFYEEYDVILTRSSRPPYYMAYHGVRDGYKFAKQGLDKLVVEGPLSEEESSWERWDFDKFYPISTYRAVYNNLGDYFKKVDVFLGAHFFEELQDLVAEEGKTLGTDGRKVTEQTSKPEPAKPVQSYSSQPESASKATSRPAAAVSTPAPGRPAARVSVDWVGLADGSYNGQVYKGIEFMTEEMKACVVAVNEDGSFQYVSVVQGQKLELGVNLFAGGSENFITPWIFTHCPLTGEEYPPMPS